MPFKDPERKRGYQREWARKHREKNRKRLREQRREHRKKILEILGDKCVYCGCDIPEALEINHKYGGGYKEIHKRKRGTRGFYLDIIAGRRTTEDLELTCKICNSWHQLVKLRNLPDYWEIKWKPL